MSRVFLISDTHFFHRNIQKYRKQFSSSQEHDDYVLGNILSTVRKRDILIMGGDNSIVYDELNTEEVLNLFRTIRDNVGYLKYIIGNHDVQTKKGQDILRQLFAEGTIDELHGLFKYKQAWLSHAPIHPDELYSKYCIHGHTHDKNIDDNRYFNISCENINFKPIDYQYVIKLLREGITTLMET